MYNFSLSMQSPALHNAHALAVCTKAHFTPSSPHSPSFPRDVSESGPPCRSPEPGQRLCPTLLHYTFTTHTICLRQTPFVCLNWPYTTSNIHSNVHDYLIFTNTFTNHGRSSHNSSGCRSQSTQQLQCPTGSEHFQRQRELKI